MKLLLDQGLPLSASQLLRHLGIDTVHTGEIGFETADDVLILARARDERRVVVTLDADFHTLMALGADASPSVIRLRIERLRADALAHLLIHLVETWSTELDAGVLLTVQVNRVRMHRLPIVR